VANLAVEADGGPIMFTNTAAAPVVATSLLKLTSLNGDINTPADRLNIAFTTPTVNVTIGALFNAYLTGNVSADAVTRAALVGSTNQVGSTQAEMVRFFLEELKKNVGIGIVEDLVLFGSTNMEGITAPLAFQRLQINAPKCLAEQINSVPCN